MNYLPPKGMRALSRKAADAIVVAQVPGVLSAEHDPSGTVTYVKCSKETWADIQVRAARVLGVKHTAELRRAMLARVPQESAVLQSYRVFADGEGFGVRVNDRKCAPRWNSRGAAEAYIDGLTRGERQPEWEEVP